MGLVGATREDLKTIKLAYDLEDMQLNSEGWKEVASWIEQQRQAIMKLDNIDTTKSAEEVKINVAIEKAKLVFYDNLLQHISNKINEGKQLEIQLSDKEAKP